MFYEFTNTKLGSIIGLTDHYQLHRDRFSIREGIVSILWNRNCESVSLRVDRVPFKLAPNQIITLTYLQTVEFEKMTLLYMLCFLTGSSIVF